MTLREKQEIFTRNVGKLIEYIFDSGYTCTLGECYRTQEQADLNEAKGIGSKHSLHLQRLAVDINIFLNGQWLKKSEDYEFAGIYWEALHPDNVNGRGGNDGNHFAMSSGDGKW